MFDWIEVVGLSNVISNSRETLESVSYKLPDWIIYSLPDGLWTYSFSASIILIWNNNNRHLGYWIMIPILFSILPEMLQGLRIFPGTFDMLDLIFMAVAFEISYFSLNLKNQPYEN
jgi:hypothetical protein